MRILDDERQGEAEEKDGDDGQDQAAGEEQEHHAEQGDRIGFDKGGPDKRACTSFFLQ